MLAQNQTLKRTLIDWSPPLVLALACAVFQYLDWVMLLRYQRDLVGSGQLWRLLTGNLVHLGWAHWLMNSLGLLLVWALFEPFHRSVQMAGLLLLCCLLVGMGLYWFSPNVGWYVGLSGALHGLLIAGLLRQVQHQPGFSLAVLGLVVGKLIWEQVFGPLPGSEQTAGGPVVIIAHTYGAVAGLLIALPQLICRILRPKT